MSQFKNIVFQAQNQFAACFRTVFVVLGVDFSNIFENSGFGGVQGFGVRGSGIRDSKMVLEFFRSFFQGFKLGFGIQKKIVRGSNWLQNGFRSFGGQVHTETSTPVRGWITESRTENVLFIVSIHA